MFSRNARLIMFLVLIISFQINALDTTEFNDSKQQERYQALTNELRCLVCQNESISGSSSELAQDLRKQVAKQIRAGQSDTQIRAYMSERYGDFIHYRPPNEGKTKLLWIAPIVFLLVLAVIFILILKSKNNQIIEDSELVEELE